MAGTTAYPTTAQDMLDRLLTDREFLIRTIVTDNYPAVRGKFKELLQDGQPALIDSPEKLAAQLVWWDRSQGAVVVDPVLDVPFRNAAGSNVLSDAMAQGRDMVEQSGVAAKSFITDGIGAIVGGVGNIVNGRYISDATERTQAAAIAAQAATDAQKTAQRGQLVKWGIIAGTLVLVIALLVIYRTKQ